MEAPDHNTEKWTAFCKDDDAAEGLLQQKCLILSQRKLIISAKKQLIESKSHPHGLFIYKFVIITSPK
jgi:hypothetical protein